MIALSVIAGAALAQYPPYPPYPPEVRRAEPVVEPPVPRALPVESRLMGDDGIGARAGMVVRVEHPVIGEHTRMTNPVRFSRSVTKAEAGCTTGQHTDAVLREIGLDDARIADLRAREIVGGS